MVVETKPKVQPRWVAEQQRLDVYSREVRLAEGALTIALASKAEALRKTRQAMLMALTDGTFETIDLATFFEAVAEKVDPQCIFCGKGTVSEGWEHSERAGTQMPVVFCSRCELRIPEQAYQLAEEFRQRALGEVVAAA